MSPAEARVEERVDTIERSCERLDRMAADGRDRFDADSDTRDVAALRVQLGVQAAIDIASHLIAARGWTRSSDYRGLFLELGRREVLSPELAARLADAAGMRNVLVHGYLEVDPDLLWGAVVKGPADLRAFVAAVYRLLASEAQGV